MSSHGHWELFTVGFCVVFGFFCFSFQHNQSFFLFEHFFIFSHYKIPRAHLVHAMPTVLESVIAPKSCSSLFWRLILKIKIWVISVIIAGRLLMRLGSWMAEQGNTCILTQANIHVHKCLSVCRPIYICIQNMNSYRCIICCHVDFSSLPLLAVFVFPLQQLRSLTLSNSLTYFFQLHYPSIAASNSTENNLTK